MRKALIAALCFVLGACATRVPVTDVASIDPSERASAAAIQVFAVGQQSPRPQRVIGNLQAFSCKHLMWEPPASKGNALEQLQLQASKAGANALVNVTFDTRGTDTYGTDCWESVQASGLAVVLGR